MFPVSLAGHFSGKEEVLLKFGAQGPSQGEERWLYRMCGL